MELAFKHLAVRMWASLMLGGLTALVILPLLASTFGPGLMIGPAFFFILIFYWLLGIVFATIGRRRLNRLSDEATVWARAGMAREARQALARAEATLNSYYFSPFSRKAPATQLLAQLARFQLSQSHSEPSSDAVIATYLRHFPRDREAAIKWLERILKGRSTTRQSYDIAADISANHAEDMTIQRMLAQFYLVQGCCDFAALKTFRQLVDSQDSLPDELLSHMTDLFLAEQRADNLALEVYLRAHEQGRTDSRLLEGIAACCYLVHSTPLMMPLLEKAESILSDTEPTKRQEMALRFSPEIAEGKTFSSRSKKRMSGLFIGPLLYKALAGTFLTIGNVFSAILAGAGHVKTMLLSSQVRTAIKWTVMGLFSVGVGWLAVSTGLHLAQNLSPVEKKAPDPVVTPVSDPFTLQVAAYLKEDDARSHVDQLKKQGLDAYWTRDKGNNRTWFKVRISHYKTKDEARSMGETLKNRHLISDYYVANYKRPEGP
ncbi:uncharacterized protein Dvar_53630 [Desulfosarcina variabilis str. Montpellier]|uniref:SPOR domain-containing protein n=1 Tax=Desulfosarcina variabilis TaxID=2300 RepID=UPI003AFA68B1